MDQNNDDGGIDLSHALDDSSSRIKFEGEEFQRPRSFETPTPKIVGVVIKYSGGYIKDEKQASYVLIGFVVLAIVVSLFLFFGSGSSSYNEKIIPPMPAAGVGDPNFRP
ncbi:MAG: hypothetical protein NUV64_02375 [Parcubacteria group bacterium]|nr:hypothetical protein [Parcubacteria group bacterium]MCR4342868.1 hypothetical protein [Patescibacteria group bacterium]